MMKLVFYTNTIIIIMKKINLDLFCYPFHLELGNKKAKFTSDGFILVVVLLFFLLIDC